MTASLSQRRSHAREGARRINATVAGAVEDLRAQKASEHAAAKKAAAEREANRHRFTREEVQGARLVRIHGHWHVVARVNAKSVTVKTPYSWTDRWALDKVEEIRR